MDDPRMAAEGEHTAPAVDPRMSQDEWRIWDLEGEVEDLRAENLRLRTRLELFTGAALR